MTNKNGNSAVNSATAGSKNFCYEGNEIYHRTFRKEAHVNNIVTKCWRVDKIGQLRQSKNVDKITNLTAANVNGTNGLSEFIKNIFCGAKFQFRTRPPHC